MFFDPEPLIKTIHIQLNFFISEIIDSQIGLKLIVEAT
jgi:hypothetical protein